MHKNHFITFYLCFVYCGILSAKDVNEVIPITMQNIQGHKNLYNEGWFVVTSSRQALDYAYQQSYTSSADVWSKLISDLKTGKQNYKSQIKQNTNEAADESVKLKKELELKAEQMEREFRNSRALLQKQSQESIKKAYQEFVLGYMELRTRTNEDLQELKNISGNYFGDLKEDFSNFHGLVQEIDQKTEKAWLASWQKSLLIANAEFEQEYRHSGNQSNSIAALWSMSKGYMKSLYYGIFKPSTAMTVGILGAGYQLTERVLLNTGKSFFYVGKVGYKIISPSVEGGFFSALALIAWSSEKSVQLTQSGLSVFNQVAIASAEPVYKTGKWLMATTTDTADYVVASSFEVASGVSRIAVNQVKAGVVLGYNALTALPTQTLLGCANSLVFLAYDGPRLAVYSLKGEINGVPVGEMPVGTVIDKQKIEHSNMQLEKVSDDPILIQTIIEKSKEDL